MQGTCSPVPSFSRKLEKLGPLVLSVAASPVRSVAAREAISAVAGAALLSTRFMQDVRRPLHPQSNPVIAAAIFEDCTALPEKPRFFSNTHE
jgi:hypothetical protein